MARGKALEASQRVLVTIGADMKQQADELFELQGISFSEGVRRALGLLLSSQAKQAVTVDSKTLRQAEKALSAMGMDVDTAVSVFLREVARTGCIPFAVQSGKGQCTYAIVPIEQTGNGSAQND